MMKRMTITLGILLAFVAGALAHCGSCGVGGSSDKTGHGHMHKLMEHAGQNTEMAAESYPLDRCPISGEKLGEMGEPYEMSLDGVTVKLCCDGCEEKAIQRKDEVKGKIREALFARDAADYPLETCANCRMKIDPDSAKKEVYGSTLVLLCGSMCEKAFAEKGEQMANRVREARAAAE